MHKHGPNSLDNKCGGREGLGTQTWDYQLVLTNLSKHPFLIPHKDWSSGSYIHSANTFGAKYLASRRKVTVRLGSHLGHTGCDCWPASSPSPETECWTLYFVPVMKEAQPNRKPWLLDIEFCPITLCLPTTLATQDMEFRGFRDNDKEKAQSKCEEWTTFRRHFLSPLYFLRHSGCVVRGQPALI